MTLAQTFQAEAMAHAQTAMLSHGAPTKRLFQNLQSLSSRKQTLQLQ